jgi:hypothetical protein
LDTASELTVGIRIQPSSQRRTESRRGKAKPQSRRLLRQSRSLVAILHGSIQLSSFTCPLATRFL